MTQRIYIILPVHNRLSATRSFLACLRAQTCQNFHLILVNDGSTDGTVEFVRNELPDATILEGDGNLWWGGSLQKGFEWIRDHCPDGNEIVLTINDDTHFKPSFLENAARFLEANPGTLLGAQCFDLRSGRHVDSGVAWDWSNGTMRLALHDGEINCFSTRGLFMRVSDFRRLGGFHPFLLPHYLSDYEFTMRAPRKGLRMRTDPTVTVATDETPAGRSDFDRRRFSVFLSQYFSKKNYRQPVYVFFFIYFACPGLLLKLRNWWSLGREIGRCFRSALLPPPAPTSPPNPSASSHP